MANHTNVQENRRDAGQKNNNTARHPPAPDRQDNANEDLQPDNDSVNMELPDVSDIPGQEHITAIGPLGEMADTTISSDDEEGLRDGKDVLEEDDDDTFIVMGTEADVTEEDLALLGPRDQDMDGGDDELTRKEGLDDTDFDGELLNEGISNMDTTGEDLDIPEADGDDPEKEALGQGDEENNYYSLGSDDNDNITEGTP